MISLEEVTAAMNEPYTPEQKAKSEMECKSMESNTQILLSIFEKVVCIEHMLEAQNKPIQPQLSMGHSLMLEGEDL